MHLLYSTFYSLKEKCDASSESSLFSIIVARGCVWFTDLPVFVKYHRAGFSNKLNGRPATFGAALETENFLKIGLSVPSAWNLCCKPGAWNLELQTGCLGPLSADMLFILRRKLKFSLQRVTNFRPLESAWSQL